MSSPLTLADDAARAAQERFFESKIRPLLFAKCFSCHGEKKQKSDLRLDSLGAMLAGGESGPALVRGQPDRSLIVRAVRYADADLQMPPKEKLSKAEIGLIEKWVRLGAHWPGSDGKVDAPVRRGDRFEITQEDRDWWAFRKIESPPAPDVKDESWAASAVDRMILSRLEAEGLAPSKEATRRELIRRAFFDLVGLPPTPQEVEAFVGSKSPTAFEDVIDDLLSRPQFGERWGRHWLDVVRFAQTNGYERDGEKQLAWRYRDYVIQAFNADKPYDRFVLEQLAGDELEDATRDSIVATAFYRLGVWDDEPDDKRLAEFEGLDDMIVATGAAFLGLTVGCARCHDHMFDPVPQSDYYQMLAFVRNVRYYENPREDPKSATFVPLATAAENSKFRNDRDDAVRSLESQLAAASPETRKRLEEEIKMLREKRFTHDWTLGVKEHGRSAPKTQLLARGNPATPIRDVEPAFLTVLGGEKPKIAPAPEHCQSSGRRRALAEWIASADHPLTARVIVNRVWQHLFGRGIVRTPNDFGRRGLPPTHPEIIDWMAKDLISGGWHLKPLIRKLMLTHAYRMSSRATNARALKLDPGNDLFWRQNMKRLEAEAIRDAILATSGRLNSTMGGRGVFPRLSPDVLIGGSRPGWGWGFSSEEERSRRSVYLYVKRGTLMPLMEGFDYTNTAQPIGARPVTTVAPQALMLLNSRFLTAQSRHFAGRLAKEAGDDAFARVDLAYRIAMGRRPTDRERDTALAFLERQEALHQQAAPRAVFRPAVPTAIEKGFQNLHRVEQYFFDPPKGWTYHRGRWTDAGDNINWVDPKRTPFAIWSGASFVDAEVEARIVLHANSESGALLLRCRENGGLQEGYEVVLDARERQLSIRRHEKGRDVMFLATTRIDFLTETPIDLRVRLRGGELKVWVDGSEDPVAAATDATPIQGEGKAGVRTWGAAMSVERLVVASENERHSLALSRERSPEMDALASLCLVLLNTNEFVYVD